MEKKLNKKRVKKNKKPKNVLVITTIYVICFSVIAGVFAYTRINKYEEGVLEVCATQQDAYVQLVLDQINLKSNRDDEQIINDILGTMNSSSNKYWTFSKNQSILFRNVAGINGLLIHALAANAENGLLHRHVGAQGNVFRGHDGAGGILGVTQDFVDLLAHLGVGLR